jgi:hypothetical protein
LACRHHIYAGVPPRPGSTIKDLLHNTHTATAPLICSNNKQVGCWVSHAEIFQISAHAPYIHTCRTKHSHANPKIDFRWPKGRVSKGLSLLTTVDRLACRGRYLQPIGRPAMVRSRRYHRLSSSSRDSYQNTAVLHHMYTLVRRSYAS